MTDRASLIAGLWVAYMRGFCRRIRMMCLSAAPARRGVWIWTG